ncbi:hypothetical protein [Luteolibacter sp. Populi]|uniref:hypothetical protein n=1 Tax=Luteolibacter sp. Populi TaxID=3230487 RepID=UPI0034661318
MKVLLSALSLLLLLLAGGVQAGPLGEVDSHETAFHRTLHESKEIYLVCYHKVEVKRLNNILRQIDIGATIVAVVKGKKTIGEKITFTRLADEEPRNVPGMLGGLHYVAYIPAGGGKDEDTAGLTINAQDPHAVFTYSAGLSAIAAEHHEPPPAKPER